MSVSRGYRWLCEPVTTVTINRGDIVFSAVGFAIGFFLAITWHVV